MNQVICQKRPRELNPICPPPMQLCQEGTCCTQFGGQIERRNCSPLSLPSIILPLASSDLQWLFNWCRSEEKKGAGSFCREGIGTDMCQGYQLHPVSASGSGCGLSVIFRFRGRDLLSPGQDAKDTLFLRSLKQSKTCKAFSGGLTDQHSGRLILKAKSGGQARELD